MCQINKILPGIGIGHGALCFPAFIVIFHSNNVCEPEYNTR